MDIIAAKCTLVRSIRESMTIRQTWSIIMNRMSLFSIADEVSGFFYNDMYVGAPKTKTTNRCSL